MTTAVWSAKQSLFMTEWLRFNARNRATKVAYICGDAQRTWREVDEESDRLASGFAGVGIQPGARVALIAHNWIDWPTIHFGLLKTGCTIALIHPQLWGTHLVRQLRHADVKAVVSGPTHGKVVADIRAELGDGVLHIGADDGDVDVTLDSLASSPVTELNIGRSVDDPAFLTFTSGTTGVPKGAVHTHFTYFWRIANLSLAWRLRPEDVALAGTPLNIAGTHSLVFATAAYLGMTTVILDKFSPEAVVDGVRNKGVSFLFAVPTMSSAITTHTARMGRWAEGVKLMSAGAALPEALLERLWAAGFSVFNALGSSEAVPLVMINDEELRRHPTSVGRPWVGAITMVLDEEGREVAPGEVGEFVGASDGMAVGYFNQPELQAAAFRGGWFHTGDLVRVDDEGFYYYVGRKKEMIISGGMNVYPVEIEDVLCLHPNVVEAAVVGVPDDYWGEAVTAAVVVREETDVDELIRHCQENLAKFQVPKRIEIRDELPRGVLGKLDKITLKASLELNGAQT